MHASITDAELERYLDESLPASRRAEIKAALDESSDLRARLEAFRDERALIHELRAAAASRLPADEEKKIIERGLRSLSDS